MDYTKHYATRLRRLMTPQAEKIPGSDQVPNSAGGYAWRVSKWDRLDRFLVLGAEGGTYYISERAFSRESARSRMLSKSYTTAFAPCCPMIDSASRFWMTTVRWCRPSPG